MMSIKRRPVPRGIRNNNPLNIRVGQNWCGEMAETDKTPEQAAETEFEVFDTMADGVRAGFIILRGYQDYHGLKSVTDLINRWAPPTENNSRAYADYVAKCLGVDVSAEVDVKRYAVAFPLIRAMATMECGAPPADADINAGLVKAGLAIGDRPLGRTRTVKAARLATGATVAGGVLDMMRQIDTSAFGPDTVSSLKAILTEMLPYAPFAKWGLTGVALFSLAAVIYARWDDRRLGVR